MFKKVFNLKVMLLVLAAALSASFLDAKVYGVDALNNTCLRNPIVSSSESGRARQICASLTLVYQKSIKDVVPLSSHEAFAKFKEEMPKYLPKSLSIRIKRHKDGLWAYYDAEKKQDSFYMFMNNNGEFEPKAMEDFNKMRLYDFYIYNNAPRGIVEVGIEHVESESIDARPFIAVPGFLLATGKVSYIDYAPSGREVIFIDQAIYYKYKNAIDSGKRQPDYIDTEDLPDHFIPEGHLNRAVRLISQVQDKIKAMPKLLDYVNKKRKEIAKKRGKEIEDLKDTELIEIMENINLCCLNKSDNYAFASFAEDKVGFSLPYLSVLSDEEFEVVFSHELAHFMTAITVPDSEIEDKLYELKRRFLNGEDKETLKNEFSEREADEISEAWVTIEDAADSIAVRITRYRNSFSACLNKTSGIPIDENSGTRRVYKFFRFLGIKSHPMDFLRGCYAWLELMDDEGLSPFTGLEMRDITTKFVPADIEILNLEELFKNFSTLRIDL